MGPKGLVSFAFWLPIQNSIFLPSKAGSGPTSKATYLEEEVDSDILTEPTFFPSILAVSSKPSNCELVFPETKISP